MIKIIHLYPDLMNLYGGSADMDVLRLYLEACGQKVEITHAEVGDRIDVAWADLVYIGAGTEHKMLAAASDLERCRDDIRAYVEAGGNLLLTGNASVLACEKIKDLEGKEHKGLGLIGGHAEIGDYRHYSDVIGWINEKLGLCLGDDKSLRIIGATNSSHVAEFEAEPFLSRLDVDSNAYIGETEGFIYKNVIGTQVAAPLLARNPQFLREYAERIAGEKLQAPEIRWLEEAELGYDYASGMMEGE